MTLTCRIIQRRDHTANDGLQVINHIWTRQHHSVRCTEIFRSPIRMSYLRLLNYGTIGEYDRCVVWDPVLSAMRYLLSGHHSVQDLVSSWYCWSFGNCWRTVLARNIYMYADRETFSPSSLQSLSTVVSTPYIVHHVIWITTGSGASSLRCVRGCSTRGIAFRDWSNTQCDFELHPYFWLWWA